MLDSLPPDMDMDGIGFALAEDMPPLISVVDWNIDEHGCWAVEMVNDALAEQNQYPIYATGDAHEYMRFLGLIFDMDAATGPGAYNSCVQQAQANCPGSVCWVTLWGPSQNCLWQCKVGSKPCSQKPVYLTYSAVVEYVGMD